MLWHFVTATYTLYFLTYKVLCYIMLIKTRFWFLACLDNFLQCPDVWTSVRCSRRMRWGTALQLKILSQIYGQTNTRSACHLVQDMYIRQWMCWWKLCFIAGCCRSTVCALQAACRQKNNSKQGNKCTLLIAAFILFPWWHPC